MMRPRRTRCPSAPSGCACSRKPVRSPVVSVKPTVGCAMARRLTTSEVAMFSARSLFRNLRRAGVAENSSRTSTCVPQFSAAGRTACLAPRSITISQPAGASRCRERMARCATEPIDGSASPRNPSVAMLNRSSSLSLEVACRSTASARSAALMPCPSSVTRISDSPPAAVTTSISCAPASMAFSTSSLTTLAGRSITSPAAMRLTISGLSWRIGTGAAPSRIAIPTSHGHSGGRRRYPALAPSRCASDDHAPLVAMSSVPIIPRQSYCPCTWAPVCVPATIRPVNER